MRLFAFILLLNLQLAVYFTCWLFCFANSSVPVSVIDSFSPFDCVPDTARLNFEKVLSFKNKRWVSPIIPVFDSNLEFSSSQQNRSQIVYLMLEKHLKLNSGNSLKRRHLCLMQLVLQRLIQIH